MGSSKNQNIFRKFSENISNFFRFQKKSMIFFIDRSKIVLRSEHAQVERPNNELGGTRPPQVQVRKNVTKCSRMYTKYVPNFETRLYNQFFHPRCKSTHKVDRIVLGSTFFGRSQAK